MMNYISSIDVIKRKKTLYFPVKLTLSMNYRCALVVFCFVLYIFLTNQKQLNKLDWVLHHLYSIRNQFNHLTDHIN